MGTGFSETNDSMTNSATKVVLGILIALSEVEQVGDSIEAVQFACNHQGRASLLVARIHIAPERQKIVEDLSDDRHEQQHSAISQQGQKEP